MPKNGFGVVLTKNGAKFELWAFNFIREITLAFFREAKAAGCVRSEKKPHHHQV